jgi:hypothetical protein
VSEWRRHRSARNGGSKFRNLQKPSFHRNVQAAFVAIAQSFLGIRRTNLQLRSREDLPVRRRVKVPQLFRLPRIADK